MVYWSLEGNEFMTTLDHHTGQCSAINCIIPSFSLYDKVYLDGFIYSFLHQNGALVVSVLSTVLPQGSSPKEPEVTWELTSSQCFSFTLAEALISLISLSICGRPLPISSPPTDAVAYIWRWEENMKDTIKRRCIRAALMPAECESVIRKTSEPDALLLCPSHRQSYPFNWQ